MPYPGPPVSTVLVLYLEVANIMRTRRRNVWTTKIQRKDTGTCRHNKIKYVYPLAFYKEVGNVEMPHLLSFFNSRLRKGKLI
jgi:hypothetical protein